MWNDVYASGFVYPEISVYIVHKLQRDKQGRNIGIGDEMLTVVHWTRHNTCSPRVDVK